MYTGGGKKKKVNFISHPLFITSTKSEYTFYQRSLTFYPKVSTLVTKVPLIPTSNDVLLLLLLLLLL